MQLKEFANKLNGREYKHPQFAKEEIEEAKANGIVIVYGASDDLIELDGAICDEAGVWDGGTVHIQWPYMNAGQKIGGGIVAGNNGQQNVMSITAKWCEDKDENGNTISWAYETSVPHETFDIMEDGEVYCRGIVFSIAESESEPEVENFVVNYSNGTKKVIKKGFFCEMKEEDGESVLTFTMADVSGKELSAIVIGCIQLAERLGLFDKDNSCQNKECPYQKDDEECPAREGCAGYEGAADI